MTRVNSAAPENRRHRQGRASVACAPDSGRHDEIAFCAWDLENERGQLVERVDGHQAHKDERDDHQIEAKMHEGLAAKCFLPRVQIAQGREPNSVGIRKGDRPANYSSAIGRESLRRRGSEVMPSSRTSSVGGLLFDASFLLVHAPRKILIPHSTTTMADTSVAAVNTLSKEATLILLSASQPH